MLRMLRNLVGVKPDARNEDLKRYRMFVTSLPPSSPSSPFLLFTTHIQPIVPDYEHALRLYPLPTRTRALQKTGSFLTLLMKRSQVVLVDRYDRYRLLTSSTPTMTNTSTLMWKVPVMLKRGKTGNGIRPGENLAIAKMFVECLPMSRLLSTPLVSKESQS